jgi:alkaline phosphatase D
MGRRVQVILLDTRYNRSPFALDKRSKKECAWIGKVGNYVPNRDESTSILGREQWTWLEAQLRQPAEVRLICSSTQIIPDQKGMDEWGCFPHEREKLFDLIRKTRANGVVLLTGNVHFTEISQLPHFPCPLLEFTSSGMTHIDEAYGKAENKYRVAGPFIELNFGLVEIDWNAKPAPAISFKAIGVGGATAFEYSVSLGALHVKKTGMTIRGKVP